MRILETPTEMRTWADEQRRNGRTIGCVPTMGALHEGHASLIRAAVAENDAAVLTLFVNPTQFGPNEDFSRYPRTFDADRALAESLGVASLYVPTAQDMYPDGYATYVEVEELGNGLCGRSRPGHFRGVATVVTKLLCAVKPHRAYFGQKDAQQLAIIQRMTRDLDLGVEIVPMPIVREPDGLAMSSRNRYLSVDDRQRALCLHRALETGRNLMAQGERRAAKVLDAVRQELAEADRVDYVELVNAETLTPLEQVDGRVLLAVAAFVGTTRLIDNLNYEV